MQDIATNTIRRC